MEDLYLTVDNCKKVVGDSPVVVFGVGADSDNMLSEIPESVNIIGFIDNYRNGTIFHGKNVDSVSEFCKKRKDQKVIITSKRYTDEMLTQLEREGLKKGEDLYIWDNECVFHDDENIRKFIDLNKRIWNVPSSETGNKILILFENKHLSRIIQEGYIARYFASKYKAEIWGINILDGKYSDASEVMKEIYRSCCGMRDIVDYHLSESQIDQVDMLYKDIWKSIETWEDWNNIRVYDIHFGTTMMRHFQRFFSLDFDPKAEKMGVLLRKALSTIVFWYDYFENNKVKTVLLSDGVLWEGYIRDIAITKGIPAYAYDICQKLFLNHHIGEPYQYFGKFWTQLSPEEQQYGLTWAEEHLNKRVQGSMEDIEDIWLHKSLFAREISEKREVEENNRIKILICPHIFEEDSYYCGEQLFDNSYVSWLCHVGEIANNTPEYDWYIKMHPDSSRLDDIFMRKYLSKYKTIRRISTEVSPHQLKKEGIDIALTVCGSIGHEYPAIGINVINAGRNPGSCFLFNINPKTKEEYDKVLMNLKKYANQKIDKAELYKFYCIAYLYYNWERSSWKEIFFENELLKTDADHLQKKGIKLGTWVYELYMKEWTEKKHQRVLEKIEGLVNEMDNWRPDVFYKCTVKDIDIKHHRKN